MNAVGARYAGRDVSHDDRTTAKDVAYEAAPASSWFLIVSTSPVATKVVPLADGAELVLGRASGCDVPIEHDGVSRKHAVIRRSGDDITVSDLGSRNRTLVNGAATSIAY